MNLPSRLRCVGLVCVSDACAFHRVMVVTLRVISARLTTQLNKLAFGINMFACDFMIFYHISFYFAHKNLPMQIRRSHRGRAISFLNSPRALTSILYQP